MKINVAILSEPIEPTEHKMVCVSKEKYSDVDLCLAVDNGNIVFASIMMSNGYYLDKQQQFEALKAFGEQIAKLGTKNTESKFMGYWEIFLALHHTSGTDKYLCPEYAEENLRAACEDADDETIRAAVNGFRNHKKRLPKVDVKNAALKARFERHLK